LTLVLKENGDSDSMRSSPGIERQFRMGRMVERLGQRIGVQSLVHLPLQAGGGVGWGVVGWKWNIRERRGSRKGNIIKYDGVAGLGREEVGGFFGWDDGGVGNRYG
jgi:hypothetical protein